MPNARSWELLAMTLTRDPSFPCVKRTIPINGTCNIMISSTTIIEFLLFQVLFFCWVVIFATSLFHAFGAEYIVINMTNL